MKHTVEVAGRRFTVEVGDLSARPIVAEVDGQRFEVWPTETPAAAGSGARIAMPKVRETGSAAPAHAVGAAGGGTASVVAPLPGVVVAIEVQPGSQVVAGQTIVMIEAMKMKNAIRAPRAGRIETVLVGVGQHVQHGDPLVRYAAD